MTLSRDTDSPRNVPRSGSAASGETRSLKSRIFARPLPFFVWVRSLIGQFRRTRRARSRNTGLTPRSRLFDLAMIEPRAFDHALRDYALAASIMFAVMLVATVASAEPRASVECYADDFGIIVCEVTVLVPPLPTPKPKEIEQPAKEEVKL